MTKHHFPREREDWTLAIFPLTPQLYPLLLVPFGRGADLGLKLGNGATLEEAQRLANHADIRTTMLYDRRDKTVKRGVVERIVS